MESSASRNPAIWKPLMICVAIPLAVGGLSALLTRNGMQAFAGLNQPDLSPPGWAFPVVWSLLYLLMGVASYLALFSAASGRAIAVALAAYGVQLAMNFCWSLLYFNAGKYLTAFYWLLGLWLMIGVTTYLFFRIDRKAGALMLPYWGWVGFAGYLNYMVYLLN